MKKIISKVVPLMVITALVLPGSVLAKNGKEPVKVKQSSNMNAMWNRVELTFEGPNTDGKYTIKDNNPVFDYELVSEPDNLEEGDQVLVNVINRGGNVVKQLYYTVGEVADPKESDTEEDSSDIKLKSVTASLDETYGAVRFLNFNNLGTGSEVYLTDEQENLGTTERTNINFYKGTTIDDDNPIGDWERYNDIRFGYDADEGEVWVELDAEHEYQAEYDTAEDAEFDAIQFMLVNREEDQSTVKLQNVKLNGEELDDIVLTGDSDFPKWNLEGDIQDADGNFTLEAELVITGEQPKNERNKVEIVFGNK